MRRSLVVVSLVAVFIAGIAGGAWWSGVGGAGGEPGTRTPAQPGDEVWTCPMHPQIRKPAPGTCDLCGMDLVRLKRSDAGPRELVMTEADKKLSELVTAPVERRAVEKLLRLVGKVDFDETRMRTISARVPGRLDRLFVDYTGVPVRRGDHLVELYSPALLAAQQELLEARRRMQDTAAETSEFLRESSRKAFEAARDKLTLWGLAADEIDAILARGEPRDRLELRSPIEGVVVHKPLSEGDYVQEGQRIYVIAELGRLWVLLDAWEQDLSWLRYGQEAEIRTEAYPGEVERGWISFVDPVLDERTRTVKVRVVVDNAHGRLKPGMFVRAVVRSKLTATGKTMEPRLAGKWICPMHPEVVAGEAGRCPVCGMDLVTAESLGYVAGESGTESLVVPASAVLWTGKRSMVYVEVPDRDRPTYASREVVLGPRAGDWYVVADGLAEGERVVVQGAFVLDADMQFARKPSMMNQPGEARVFQGPELAGFRRALAPVYAAGLDLAAGLAADDLPASTAAVRRLHTAFDGLDTGLLEGRAERFWQGQQAALHRALAAAGKADDIEGLRRAFEQLSEVLIAIVEAFGHDGELPLRQAYCPMAFDNRGAAWLQQEERIANPYFGARMLRCGEVRRHYEGLR